MRKYMLACLIVLVGTAAQAASGDAVILDKTSPTLQSGTPLAQLTNFVSAAFPTVALNTVERLNCQNVNGDVSCYLLTRKTDTCTSVVSQYAAGTVSKVYSRATNNCTYQAKEQTISVTGANLTALGTWITSFWAGTAAGVLDVQCDKYTAGIVCVASGTKTLSPNSAADALIANSGLTIVGIVP